MRQITKTKALIISHVPNSIIVLLFICIYIGLRINACLVNKMQATVNGTTILVRQIEADILTISWDNSILVISCSFKVSKYISECWPR